MSSETLKQAMQRYKSSVEDVAYETKISCTTIRRFLGGSRISRLVEVTLKKWIEEKSNISIAS